jgi:hypothetical protein
MRKSLSERLRESYALKEQTPINYGPGEKDIVAGNQAQQQQPAPAAPQGAGQPAPAAPEGQPQPYANRIDITPAGGGPSYIVAYVTASKAWCVYQRQPGASKAQLMGQPQRTLADAFAKVAQGL